MLPNFPLFLSCHQLCVNATAGKLYRDSCLVPLLSLTPGTYFWNCKWFQAKMGIERHPRGSEIELDISSCVVVEQRIILY